MQAKSIFTSKVLWYNLVTMILAIATHYGWTPDQSVFSAVSEFLVIAAPPVNFILRFLTKKPVTL